MSESVAAPIQDQSAAPVGATGASDDAMKVFAGNLAFATTEEELQAAFAEVGKVTHVQIIKRGTRSLGYGFVTYETEADAQKAVQTLNKKEILGREINVEGAKPQSDLAKHNDSGNYTIDGEDGEGKIDRGGRGRGRGRGRASRGRGGATARRPRADDGEEELEDPVKENGAQQEGGAAAANGGGGLTKTARRRQKKAAAKQAEANGETKIAPAAGTPAASVATEVKPKAPREPRKPKGPPRGEPSKTLLFVANLPFTFTDEQLKSAFDGFKVKTATVIKRRFGPKTKGFGFVDMETEDDQQRALKEVHGKEVEGRELQLKVAIQGDEQKENGEAAVGGEAVAATAA